MGKDCVSSACYSYRLLAFDRGYQIDLYTLIIKIAYIWLMNKNVIGTVNLLKDDFFYISQ